MYKTPINKKSESTFVARQELRKEFWIDYTIADDCLEQLLFLLLAPTFEKNKKRRMYGTINSLKQRNIKSMGGHLNYYKSETLDSMQLMHRHPGMLLTGDTNNGKTAILLRFKELVEQNSLRRTVISKDNIESVSLKPIAYIETPPTQISALLKEILNSVNAPHNDKANVDELMINVIKALRTARVRVLMLDEFQNTLDVYGLKLPDLMNKLVYISNKASVSLILAGLPTISLAISSIHPLRNRLQRFHIPKWENDDGFQSLLKAMAKKRKIKCEPSFESEEMTDYIYSLTEGLIGEVANLISEVAGRNGDNLTRASFEETPWMPPSKRKT